MNMTCSLSPIQKALAAILALIVLGGAGYLVWYKMTDSVISRFDRALPELQAAVDADPTSAEAHFNLGFLFYDNYRQVWAPGRDEYKWEKNLAKAVTEFTEATQLDPTEAKYEFFLANAFTENMQFEEAIAHFEKAVEIKPDYTDAHFNLAVVAVKDVSPSRPLLAERHLRAVIQAQPERADAQYYLAEALMILKRFPEARIAAMEAEKLDPARAAVIEEQLLKKIDATEQEYGKRR